MNSITIFPSNETQDSLMKTLLEQLKIRFEINKNADDTLLSEEDFYKKIDHSIKQAEEGKTRVISVEAQKEMFGV